MLYTLTKLNSEHSLKSEILQISAINHLLFFLLYVTIFAYIYIYWQSFFYIITQNI